MSKIYLVYFVNGAVERSTEHRNPSYSEAADPSVPLQLFPSPMESYSAELRTWFELDSRMPRAPTDLERARAICASVHGRWTHSNDDEPSRNDPITILREASRGKRFRCVQFGIVLAGALSAFGMPSRVVAMMSRDVETRESGASHVVAEAWIASLGKWVLLDAQENAVFLQGDVPLNCAEVAARMGEPDLQVRIPGLPPGIDPRIYLDPEAFGPNFFYFQTRVDQRRSVSGQVGGEGGHRSILLCPLGAPEPRIFQRTLPFEQVTYTRSTAAFYRPPG